MVVRDGVIEAVGSEVGLQAREADEHIDLQGKWVMPGFNDAHIHVWKVGQLESFIVDLRGIESIAAIQNKLKSIAKALPAGSWIQGRGYNEQVLQDKRMPNKDDLDAISLEHPIYLIRTCAHIASVNSKSLTVAHVTNHAQAPAGGVIGKDQSGELTGIFYETALGLIASHIPSPSKEDYKQMICLGAQKLLRAGVTSATDPAVHPELLQAYKELYEQGELPIRMNLMPILLPDGGHRPYPVPQKFESDWLIINTVKFFSDGGLSGKTAALNRSYKNSNDKGVLRLQRDAFLMFARQAQQQGFRIGTHAIGDAALDLVIDVYQELSRDFGNTRNRIEHFGLPSPKHVQDVASYGFIPVPQTIFINELGENFMAAVDDDYLKRCYPVRSLLDKNITVAFSTDAPVVKNINPWLGIQTAITRKTALGSVIAASESITVKEALLAYTLGSAYAEQRETNKGKLAPGYWADFIVLDKNPYKIPTESLSDIKVEATYLAGIKR